MATAAAGASDCRYLEKVGRLQRELHQSERKRLELERKLLASNKAEQPMLKGAKLQNYLKEILEREKIAHLRNQKFLKEFECIEAHATTLTKRTDTLKQMKMEYTKQIKKILSMWNKEMNNNAEEANTKQATNSSGQTRIDRNLSKGLYHTATSFMGHQMPGTSSSSSLNPQQKYHQSTESLSFLQPHSNKQVTSVTAIHTNSMMDNLKLPMSSNGSQGVNCVSDIKDWKTGLQTSEEMPFTRIISSGSESHQHERAGSNRSIRAHSSITEKLIQDTARDVFKNCLTDEEHSHKNVIVRKTDTTLKQNKKLSLDQPKHCVFSGRCTTNAEEDEAKQPVICQTQKNDAEKVGRPSLNVLRLSAEFSTSDSDLNNSASSNEELQEIRTFEDICVLNAHPKPATVCDLGKPNGSSFAKHESCPDGNKEYIISSEKEPTPDQNIFRSSKDSNLHEKLQVSSTQSVKKEGDLSLKGFFHLLHTIENAVKKTKVTYLELYQTTTISSEKCNEITSKCNKKGSLDTESLKSCGAVILHQLQRLSQNTSHGSLLSEEILRKDCQAESDIRCSLPPCSAKLWDHWYWHTRCVLQYQGLTVDEAAKTFGPLLIGINSKSSNKAIALLKKILSKATDNQSHQSDDSSCSLPSFLTDGAVAKQAKPSQQCYLNTNQQELNKLFSSSEDDDLIENVPLTETRAYQLLKQSTVKQNDQLKQEDEEDISDLELPGLGHKKHSTNTQNKVEDKSDCSEETSLIRNRKKKKLIHPIKSKAFWGESDDSDSDIEAVLHPKAPDVLESGDDFEDFIEQ